MQSGKISVAPVCVILHFCTLKNRGCLIGGAEQLFLQIRDKCLIVTVPDRLQLCDDRAHLLCVIPLLPVIRDHCGGVFIVQKQIRRIAAGQQKRKNGQKRERPEAEHEITLLVRCPSAGSNRR